MGFIDDTLNWIWDGILVNFFSTTALVLILSAIGFAFFAFTTFLNDEVLSGMFTEERDEPIQVVLLCLFGPILLVLGIGILIGLVAGFWDIVSHFFWNIWPFVDWGEKDGLLVWDVVFSDLIAWPIILILLIYMHIFIWPLLTILILLVMSFVIIGHLWPSGNNAGSFSDTPMQYASMSFATLFMFFALVVSISFGGMMQNIMDLETSGIEDSDEYQEEDGTELWLDNDEPIVEYPQYDDAYTLHPDTEGVVILRCNSVDIRSDGQDKYQYSDDLHIRISATSDFSVNAKEVNTTMDNVNKEREFVLNPSQREFWQESLPWSIYISPGSPVQREIFYNETGSFIGGNDDWDIHMSSKNDLSTKYHIAWIIAENGSTNETSKALDKAMADAGDPNECGQYALLGSIEGRVRVASLGLVFAAIFTMGCVIHRFYIISGIHGSTDVNVLSRTFGFSLWGSSLFFSSFIAIFDPFDGTGITGITVENIVNSGDSLVRLFIIGTIILMSLVVIIAMYRQRSIIGNIAEAAKIKREDKKDLMEVRRLLDEF